MFLLAQLPTSVCGFSAHGASRVFRQSAVGWQGLLGAAVPSRPAQARKDPLGVGAQGWTLHPETCREHGLQAGRGAAERAVARAGS